MLLISPKWKEHEYNFITFLAVGFSTMVLSLSEFSIWTVFVDANLGIL